MSQARKTSEAIMTLLADTPEVGPALGELADNDAERLAEVIAAIRALVDKATRQGSDQADEIFWLEDKLRGSDTSVTIGYDKESKSYSISTGTATFRGETIAAAIKSSRW